MNRWEALPLWFLPRSNCFYFIVHRNHQPCDFSWKPAFSSWTEVLKDNTHRRQKHAPFRWSTRDCAAAVSDICPAPFQRTDAYLITLSNGCDFSSHSSPLGMRSPCFSWALSLHFLTPWFQRSSAGGACPGWSICLSSGHEKTRWWGVFRTGGWVEIICKFTVSKPSMVPVWKVQLSENRFVTPYRSWVEYNTHRNVSF